MSILEQFKDKYYTNEDFERVITTAMKELKVSRRKAMNHLMLYMTANGSVEDFKNFINYFIEYQKDREAGVSRG